MSELIVVGGGLAGCEAAWQAAEHGIDVLLFEMRPVRETGAHKSDSLAELVCSNSLGSKLIDRASGLLQEEIRRMDSLLLACAEVAAVPAGGALAVDRVHFAGLVTQKILAHPKIKVIRQEVTEVPFQPAVITSGPLTSSALADSISKLTGHENLFFYDAISPIVTSDSINLEIAFRGSRYSRGDTKNGDYINCPLTRQEYLDFNHALIDAARIELREFELEIKAGVRAGVNRFFEGCLPIEVLAERGPDSLTFGPLRPVGLSDPHTGRRPYAVVQLRQDNLAGTLYNLVGFQTNLRFPDQRRVFRMIPGLEEAEFVRYGQMHRNTFIHSPSQLKPTLQFRTRSDLFFGGQITGVEGYTGNIATGLLAGLNAALLIQRGETLTLPETTMLGALCRYITSANAQDFQPMKANYGILPPLNDPVPRGKRERAMAYSTRALQEMDLILRKCCN